MARMASAQSPEGGLNSKLHVLADAKGRPIHMFLSAGQTSDYIGARALLPMIDPSGGCSAGRPGQRCRLVPQRPDRIGDFSVHPVKTQPHSSSPTRCGTLSPAPQDREHVRAPQGLAQGRNAV